MSTRSAARTDARRALPRLTLQARVSLSLAAATAVFGIAYINAASAIVIPQLTDPVGPRAFPYLLGAGLLVCAAVLFVEGLVLFRDEEAPGPDGAETRLLIAGGVMAWTLGYVLLFDPLGYLVATTAFLFGLVFLFDGRRLVRSALVSVVFSATSYVGFNDYLDVFLPAPFFLR